ncbi:efflux RND transporter periplasmic adaptor subunit [soil metagenome]
MQPAASIALTLLCAVASIACHRKAAAEATKPLAEPPRKVALAIAVPAPTPDLLILTGSIRADQRADVTADTQGKVLAVMVERGQRVKRGQPVLQLDVAGASLQTQEAYAMFENARDQQRLADKECERSRALFEIGAISGTEADRQRTQCTAASHQVSAAAARSQMIGKSVRDGLVRAPFDGIVAERSVTVGEWVSPGRSLFTLIDSDPLKLELIVPESHVHAIKLGQPVELSTVSRPDVSYHATVTRLGAEIGRSRGLTVEATLAPAPDLVAGMFVEARVVVGHTMLPVLPATSVVKRGDTWHAFIVHDGAVEERIVQLGPSPAEGTVSIVQSIAPGDRVVQVITADIIDGLRVN